MIDLLSHLYDFDPFRFALWDTLSALHLDSLIRWGIDLAGYTLWEDWSVSK